MFRYRFGKKPKRFGIVPEFVFLEKIGCFDLVQNLFSWTKQKLSLSMEQIPEQTQTLGFHSCQMSKRLWNVCSFTVLTLLVTVYPVRVAPSNSAPLAVHYKTNVTLNSLVSQLYHEKSEIFFIQYTVLQRKLFFCLQFNRTQLQCCTLQPNIFNSVTNFIHKANNLSTLTWIAYSERKKNIF